MRHSSFLEVNLGHLAQNFSDIQKLAPKAQVLPMVKADAYGNGVLGISKHLENECQVKKLGCATLGEALYLRENGVSAEILVFSDTEVQNVDLRKNYQKNKIVPVIHHASDLEVVLTDPTLKDLPLILKLNTGMNRLGLTKEDLEKYLSQIKNRSVEHLMSHFARSSDVLKAGDKTHKQYDEFQAMKKILVDAGVEVRTTSLANSGAIEQQFAVDETYVRPGLMMYGPPSVEKPQLWNGHQISRLVTKVLTTFEVKKGVPLGYGVNVADRDGFVVIVALGYADGLIALDSGTYLNVKGHRGKLFGRINMDMAMIFFDPEVAGKINKEEQIEIWNHDNRVIADLAAQNKTITYKLMCGISSRIPRIYKVK